MAVREAMVGMGDSMGSAVEKVTAADLVMVAELMVMLARSLSTHRVDLGVGVAAVVAVTKAARAAETAETAEAGVVVAVVAWMEVAVGDRSGNADVRDTGWVCWDSEADSTRCDRSPVVSGRPLRRQFRWSQAAWKPW